MATPDYEVGMTYEKSGKYYLAINERALVTWRDGEFHEVTPYSRYEPCRSFSVDQLCKAWQVDMAKIDELSMKYFQPQVCHDASPSYRTAQRRNLNRTSPIRIIRVAS